MIWWHRAKCIFLFFAFLEKLMYWCKFKREFRQNFIDLKHKHRNSSKNVEVVAGGWLFNCKMTQVVDFYIGACPEYKQLAMICQSVRSQVASHQGTSAATLQPKVVNQRLLVLHGKPLRTQLVTTIICQMWKKFSQKLPGWLPCLKLVWVRDYEQFMKQSDGNQRGVGTSVNWAEASLSVLILLFEWLHTSRK